MTSSRKQRVVIKNSSSSFSWEKRRENEDKKETEETEAREEKEEKKERDMDLRGKVEKRS